MVVKGCHNERMQPPVSPLIALPMPLQTIGLVSDAEVTGWLDSLEQSSLTPERDGAVNRLFATLYAELKRNAASHMRKEYSGHTLSATALVHEAWERLNAQNQTDWASRQHFLAMASIMMRRILVNHALAKQALKRDIPLVSLTLTEAQQVAGDTGNPDITRIHEALLAFEAVDPRAAKVVELKFFGGLEIEEIAALLGLSTATVKRDWMVARAWLYRDLQT